MSLTGRPVGPGSGGPLGVVGGYALLEQIGQGGAGTVFRAREVQSGRPVALKIGSALDEGRLERFRREGQITASLQHPNIVRVHDAGVVNRRPYLVYQLVEDAQTLEDVLQSWPLRQRIEALRDVGRALGFAHQRGVVHRDVKPENVLVTAEGTNLLADFGLASAASLDRMTQTGVMLGTPLYLAPEVAREGAGAASPQTDVYSLGVMLYEALCGEHPYGSQGFGAVLDPSLRRFSAPAKRSRDVPGALSRICMVALAEDRGRRFASGDELADALEVWLAGGSAGSGLARVGLGVLALVAIGSALAAGLLFGATGPAPLPSAAPTSSATELAETPTTGSGRRSATREPALREALALIEAGGQNDPRVVARLGVLKGAIGAEEDVGAELADGLARLLRDSACDWGGWGLEALRRLVETGARPRDRGGTERLCEAIWAAGFRRAITLKQAEQGYVSLVELDVDLDGVHYSYEGLIPRASTSSPPASQYLHLRVGLRLRASADTDRAYEHLRRLGRDKRLGPTTRARALSLGLRSAPLTQRLAMIEEALALDPKSAHVRLAHAHTLLVAGRAGPGLAKLSPAWKEWRALYGDRRASEIEESVLLNRSLRMLLKNGLVEEARSLLRRSVTCRDHLPIGHAPRTGLLSRFDPQRGFSSAWDQAWLETGAPGQR